MIEKAEKRMHGATRRPQTAPWLAASERHVPAHVRRAAHERDGARCTFVSDDVKRCDERRFPEYDHVVEVARGGEATVDGIRLRCRAHNQFTVERTFGAEFMQNKRQAAKGAREAASAARVAEREALEVAAALERDPDRSVVPWLLHLRFNLADARRAARFCESIADATIEPRAHAALKFLKSPSRRDSSSASTAA